MRGAEAGDAEGAGMIRADRGRRAGLASLRAQRLHALTDYAFGWLQGVTTKQLNALAQRRKAAATAARAAAAAGKPAAADVPAAEGGGSTDGSHQSRTAGAPLRTSRTSASSPLDRLPIVRAEDLTRLDGQIRQAQAALAALARWVTEDARSKPAVVPSLQPPPAESASSSPPGGQADPSAADRGPTDPSAAKPVGPSADRAAEPSADEAAELLGADAARGHAERTRRAALSESERERGLSAQFVKLEQELVMAQEAALSHALELLLVEILPVLELHSTAWQEGLPPAHAEVHGQALHGQALQGQAALLARAIAAEVAQPAHSEQAPEETAQEGMQEEALETLQEMTQAALEEGMQKGATDGAQPEPQMGPRGWAQAEPEAEAQAEPQGGVERRSRPLWRAPISLDAASLAHEVTAISEARGSIRMRRQTANREMHDDLAALAMAVAVYAGEDGGAAAAAADDGDAAFEPPVDKEHDVYDSPFRFSGGEGRLEVDEVLEWPTVRRCRCRVERSGPARTLPLCLTRAPSPSPRILFLHVPFSVFLYRTTRPAAGG
jgi:hypothetical protein